MRPHRGHSLYNRIKPLKSDRQLQSSQNTDNFEFMIECLGCKYRFLRTFTYANLRKQLLILEYISSSVDKFN